MTLPLSYSRLCRPYGTFTTLLVPDPALRCAPCWAKLTPRLRRSHASNAAVLLWFDSALLLPRLRLVTCSLRLAAFFALVFFQLLVPRPGAKREHRQNRQRRKLELRIAQRGPGERRNYSVRCHRHQKLIHLTPNSSNCSGRPQSGPAAFASTIQEAGAQGRIRTSVARKERQIYSLLPLTTRPPVHISTEHSHRVPRPGTQSLLSKNAVPRAPQNSATAARQTSARLTTLAAAGISSLGELRVSFGLLLLPAAAGGALSVTIWSWRRDLNPRPSDYKSDALPAELRQPAWLGLPPGTPPPYKYLPSRDKH